VIFSVVALLLRLTLRWVLASYAKTPAFTVLELEVVGLMLMTLPLLFPRYSTVEFSAGSALFPLIVKYWLGVLILLKFTL
jgi:hypothetical protein